MLGHFRPKHKATKIFENLNPVMLVFILSDEYLCARVSVIFQGF